MHICPNVSKQLDRNVEENPLQQCRGKKMQSVGNVPQGGQTAHKRDSGASAGMRDEFRDLIAVKFPTIHVC